MVMAREVAEENLLTVWNLIQEQARPKAKKAPPRQLAKMLNFEWKDTTKDLAAQCAVLVRIEKALLKAGFKKSVYDRYDHSHQYKHGKMKVVASISGGRSGTYVSVDIC